MPSTAATVVVPDRVASASPVPPVIVTVTLPGDAARLASASTMWTTGWVEKAVPPVALLGWVMTAPALASPASTEKDELTAAVKPALVAVKVRPPPEVETERSVKVATPLTALTEAVPVSVPALNARLTVAVELVQPTLLEMVDME